MPLIDWVIERCRSDKFTSNPIRVARSSMGSALFASMRITVTSSLTAVWAFLVSLFLLGEGVEVEVEVVFSAEFSSMLCGKPFGIWTSEGGQSSSWTMQTTRVDAESINRRISPARWTTLLPRELMPNVDVKCLASARYTTMLTHVIRDAWVGRK
jgi:hypothetical protein